MMKLYRDREAVFVERDGQWLRSESFRIDALFTGAKIETALEDFRDASPISAPLAPIGSQEVWAAGVTYFRSREARMEESEKEADVYDRVYDAERPELFFKSTPHRVVGHGENVVIRDDSDWNVPEAELALAINRDGEIFGYTIGNDMSSRRIEGENPLYLPQAKIWDGSCALGPCLLVSDAPMPPATEISLWVSRAGDVVVEGRTSLAELKRSPEELVSYLFRQNSFPAGCYLLTGTGIVPAADFTLEKGDRIAITIDGIGTLENTVA